MNILAIDTSCDETSVAVTNGRRVIANVLFSQVAIHAPYGGVYPILAKREHQAKIDLAINLALKRAHLTNQQLQAVAVTFGPGLAPALEVGISKAKELATSWQLPLIPVDHIEGHIYSAFAQNAAGNPLKPFQFPLLSLIVSGGHTELVLLTDHLNYQMIGETLDDAAGEALDKAARTLGLGYPGGPIIERLAEQGNPKAFFLPRPLHQAGNLNFSYSGLKTAFKRLVEQLSLAEKNTQLANLAASFQQTVIDSLIYKLGQAVSSTHPRQLAIGGGVAANRQLRQQIRQLARQQNIPVYFPTNSKLSTDNAAMIGIAAYYKFQSGITIIDHQQLDRVPRANLDYWIR